MMSSLSPTFYLRYICVGTPDAVGRTIHRSSNRTIVEFSPSKGEFPIPFFVSDVIVIRFARHSGLYYVHYWNRLIGIACFSSV